MDTPTKSANENIEVTLSPPESPIAKGNQLESPLSPVPVVQRFSIANIAQVPSKESLVDMLRCCTKCSNIPPPGSYACMKGHVTCLTCARTLVNMICPCEADSALFCGEILAIRPCYPFTTIYQGAAMTCPEKDCSILLQGHDMYLHHEFYCPTIQRFCCTFTACAYNDVYNQDALLIHLIESHDIPLYRARHGMISVTINESNAFQARGNWKAAFIIQKDDTYFVCVYGREIIKDRTSIVVILYYFPKSPTTVYHGTTLLVGDQCCSKAYTGMLPSVMNSRRSVIKSFRCLVAPVELVLPSNNFLLQVQIHDGVDGAEHCSLEKFFGDFGEE